MEANCNKCGVKIIVKNNIYSCKTCYREYQKQYRNKQDKEEVKDYMRDYMKRYRAEYMKKYFAKRKLEMGAVNYSLSRRKEYTEKTRKNSLAYYYKNRERILKQKKEKGEQERKERLKKLIKFKRDYLNN